jgi:hypothetical protein
MKQLGNLAIVCATRCDNVLLQILNGHVMVFVGEGSGCAMMGCPWQDGVQIHQMVNELNFGKYCEKELAAIKQKKGEKI